MNWQEQIFSAFAQIAVAFGIGGSVYGILRLFLRRRVAGQSLFSFLGLVPARRQFDGVFWAVWLGIVVFGAVTVSLEFRYGEAIRDLLMSDSSPYGRILRAGIGPGALVKGLIYSFFQAGLAEELLFRGLVAKRLFRAFGNRRGNGVQALLFWLVHLFLFRLIAGEWISVLQLITFATSFGMGLVLGWVNFRKSGESIAPSWILHGSGNFASFLALTVIWPK